MTNPDLADDLLRRIAALGPLADDMRLGQLLATLGWLGEDATGRSLWDIEDEELAGVIDRFRDDLTRRRPAAAG